MKIALASPFIETSAIGRVTRVAAEALVQRGDDVDIWYEPQSQPLLDTSVACFPLDAGADIHLRLRTYDMVVYNMGDHWHNHATIFKTLRSLPGVVVMHDISLANFFAGRYLLSGRVDEYLAAVERSHGAAARLEAEARIAGSAPHGWSPDPRHSLTDEVLGQALAVVTHSRYAAEALRSPLGPTIVLPLAYHKPHRVQEAAPSTGSPRINMLLFGHLHAGRCAEQAVRALGTDRGLAERVRLDLVGSVEDPIRRDIEAAIGDAGARDVVTLHGQVDDATLERHLDSADIVLCLRDPVLEAASASLLESLWHGKATIVRDAGGYAELPDDCVVKIGPSDEELLAALRRLAGDRNERDRLGVNARRYVEAHHGADAYAAGLQRAIVEGRGARAMLATVQAVHGRLAENDLEKSPGLIGAAARGLSELFDLRFPVSVAASPERPVVHSDRAVIPIAEDAVSLAHLVARSGARAGALRVIDELTGDEHNKERLLNLMAAAPSPDVGGCDVHSFLYWYARRYRPDTYLEIGVRRGWSMAQVITGAPRISAYGIDLWTGDYAEAGNPGPSFVAAEMRRLGHDGDLELAWGNSHELLPRLRQFAIPFAGAIPWPARFACVLVDGDHTVEGARADLADAVQLVAPGGVLVFDDLDYVGDERYFGTAAPDDTRSLRSVWDDVTGALEGWVVFELTNAEHGLGIAQNLTTRSALYEERYILPARRV